MKSFVYGTTIKVSPGKDGMKTLGPGAWLNDQVINFHVERLNFGAEQVARGDVVFMDTIFFKNHLEKGPTIQQPEVACRYGVLKVSKCKCVAYEIP